MLQGAKIFSKIKALLLIGSVFIKKGIFHFGSYVLYTNKHVV